MKGGKVSVVKYVWQ